jgi:hypothetical protein
MLSSTKSGCITRLTTVENGAEQIPLAQEPVNIRE